jgi:predicted nucleic acid-binding Zn ribbon protein
LLNNKRNKTAGEKTLEEIQSREKKARLIMMIIFFIIGLAAMMIILGILSSL